MARITSALLSTLFIFAGLVSARCIQCEGKQVITFTNAVTAQQANDFVKGSIGGCATNNEYDILYVSQNGQTWTWDLRIWRYCGIGKSNYLNKDAHCIGNVCASSDSRTLTCSKIVYCHSVCFPWQCGV